MPRMTIRVPGIVLAAFALVLSAVAAAPALERAGLDFRPLAGADSYNSDEATKLKALQKERFGENALPEGPPVFLHLDYGNDAGGVPPTLEPLGFQPLVFSANGKPVDLDGLQKTFEAFDGSLTPVEIVLIDSDNIRADRQFELTVFLHDAPEYTLGFRYEDVTLTQVPLAKVARDIDLNLKNYDKDGFVLRIDAVKPNSFAEVTGMVPGDVVVGDSTRFPQETLYSDVTMSLVDLLADYPSSVDVWSKLDKKVYQTKLVVSGRTQVDDIDEDGALMIERYSETPEGWEIYRKSRIYPPSSKNGNGLGFVRKLSECEARNWGDISHFNVNWEPEKGEDGWWLALFVGFGDEALGSTLKLTDGRNNNWVWEDIKSLPWFTANLKPLHIDSLRKANTVSWRIAKGDEHAEDSFSLKGSSRAIDLVERCGTP